LKTKFLMHKISKAARIDFIIMVRLVMNFILVCFLTNLEKIEYILMHNSCNKFFKIIFLLQFL
jgi:hypothetical protein